MVSPHSNRAIICILTYIFQHDYSYFCFTLQLRIASHGNRLWPLFDGAPTKSRTHKYTQIIRWSAMIKINDVFVCVERVMKLRVNKNLINCFVAGRCVAAFDSFVFAFASSACWNAMFEWCSNGYHGDLDRAQLFKHCECIELQLKGRRYLLHITMNTNHFYCGVIYHDRSCGWVDDDRRTI